jgi:hypothetical protein
LGRFRFILGRDQSCGLFGPPCGVNGRKSFTQMAADERECRVRLAAVVRSL